jgi:large subunit ribosomal protein L22
MCVRNLNRGFESAEAKETKNSMQIKSVYRGARISAFKAREVTREIQGLPVSAALDVVAFSPKKAAGLIAKTLKSAVANAENNNNLRVDKLVVKEATVGEGPTFKRSQPKARGSAGPIRKRTSHIRIILTDEIEIVRRERKKSSPKKRVTKPAKAASKKPASAANEAPAAETAVAEAPPTQE